MRKLLKYDLKAVFRLWWIFSAAALGAGVLGGLCLRVLLSGARARSVLLEQAVRSSATAGIIVFVMALGAYWLGTFILLIWRYYSHFFTDEGYLTFTLPVSRTALLGSKLLTALIYQAAAAAVIGLSGFLFFTVGTLSREYFEFLGQVPGWLLDLSWDAEGVLFLVQGALIAVAAAALQVLYPFLCATLGSVIAKKQKLLTGVGLFFGGRMLASFAGQFALIFFGVFAAQYFDVSRYYLGYEFALLLILSGLAVGCWFWNLYLLKRKLNLS